MAHEQEATLAPWYRLADGSELASHTLSWLWGRSQAVGAILRYGDIHPTEPVGAVSTSTGKGNAPVAPGVTTPDAGTRVLHIYAVGDGDRVISSPAGADERFSRTSRGSTGVQAGAADTLVAARRQRDGDLLVRGADEAVVASGDGRHQSAALAYSHTDAYPDADTNTYSDSDADSDSHAYTNPHADSDSHAYTNSHADSDSHTYTNSHADTHAHADSDSDSHTNSHADTYADAYAYAYARADAALTSGSHLHPASEANANSDPDSYPHAHAHTNAHPDADSYSYTNSHAHTDTYAHTDAYPHFDSNAHAHANPNAHFAAHAHAHANPNAHFAAHAHGHAGARPRANSHPDIDAYPHANAHSDTHPDTNAGPIAPTHPHGNADTDADCLRDDARRYADTHSRSGTCPGPDSGSGRNRGALAGRCAGLAHDATGPRGQHLSGGVRRDLCPGARFGSRDGDEYQPGGDVVYGERWGHAARPALARECSGPSRRRCALTPASPGSRLAVAHADPRHPTR